MLGFAPEGGACRLRRRRRWPRGDWPRWIRPHQCTWAIRDGSRGGNRSSLHCTHTVPPSSFPLHPVVLTSLGSRQGGEQTHIAPMKPARPCTMVTSRASSTPVICLPSTSHQRFQPAPSSSDGRWEGFASSGGPEVEAAIEGHQAQEEPQNERCSGIDEPAPAHPLRTTPAGGNRPSVLVATLEVYPVYEDTCRAHSGEVRVP
jgi:hypothetical protein